MSTDLVMTRLSLRAVAELLVAGPQYATNGSIELRATTGGVASTAAGAAEVRVDGVVLLVDARTVELDGSGAG